MHKQANTEYLQGMIEDHLLLGKENIMEYKRCKKCGMNFSIVYFDEDETVLDGYLRLCRKCDGLETVILRKVLLTPMRNVDFTREEIYFRDRGICIICLKKCSRLEYTLRYMTPLRFLGSPTPSNVAIVHHKCNERMNINLLPTETMMKHFRKIQLNSAKYSPTSSW